MASWSNCPEHVAFPGHLLQLGFHFRLEDLGGSPSSCAARRPCDLAAGCSSYKGFDPVFLPNDASATSKSLLRGPQEYDDLVFHVFSSCNDYHMLWSYPGGRCSANASSCRLFGLHAAPFTLQFSAGSWFKGPAQATWMVTCEMQVCLISWVFPHWECVNDTTLRNPFDMFFWHFFYRGQRHFVSQVGCIWVAGWPKFRLPSAAVSIEILCDTFCAPQGSPLKTSQIPILCQ